MVKKGWLGVTGVALIALVLAAGPAPAAVPRSATLATHAVGSLFNAIGTGIATVLSRHTPITVRVQPFAGPPAWLPSMDTGETDMGILTSADAALARKGIVAYKRPFKNTRLLIAGGSLRTSFYVSKDSPFETVADLRGKRIASDFPGIPVVKLSSSAGLASAGLTYDDVIKVPVSDLQAGAQAFMEGRADATWHSVGSPAVEEANARKGVKFISVGSTPEGAKRMGEIYPGSYPSPLRPGSATGVVKDTTFVTIDIYLVATKDMNDETAYAVVKVLWEHTEELGAAYPALKAWQRELMVNKNATIPYHPGAVRFFREKGFWNNDMQALQAKLLDQ